MNKILEVKNISKKYNTLNGEVDAICNISFNLYDNEFISIVGPSGCGKSTLLSVIAGLDNNNGGEIDKGNNKIGYMLQDDALIDYYNIFDNICIGLKIQGIYNKNNIEYVNKLISKYNLDEFKYKYPYQLSGGMRQKVSLIRTLAIRPNILLLDEPFSRLDYNTRMVINDDIYKIIKSTGISTIMVTHDINEAISMSDRVIVLSKSPSIIKNIYKIDIKGIPSDRKKDKLFYEYYNKIIDDINV